MKKVKWCLEQKRGIELVEPNEVLSKEYLKESDDTLETMFNINGKWKVITAYYACYNALYSILMKAGIKSEIHDCTIELLKHMKGFHKDDYEFLKGLKTDRIDAQYYLKEKKLSDENRVKEFILKCKTILKEEDLNHIREMIKDYGTKK